MKITEQDKKRIIFSTGFGKAIAQYLHANVSSKDADPDGMVSTSLPF